MLCSFRRRARCNIVPPMFPFAWRRVFGLHAEPNIVGPHGKGKPRSPVDETVAKLFHDLAALV